MIERITGRCGALIVLMVVLAGCAAAAPTTPTPVAAVSAPPPGTFRVTGAVTTPGELTIDKLKGMPQQTVMVSFGTGKGPEQHTETGVALSELLPPAALATQDRKNDLLSFAVLAIGSDGYAALVAYGEVSPDFGNKAVLLAVQQDGTDLARPRLVVPGDVKGGRYVTDVVELHVARVSTG